MGPFLIQGSGTVIDVKTKEIILENYPIRFETALNPAVISGLSTSIKSLSSIKQEIFRHITQLTKYFRNRILHELSDVYIPSKILDFPDTPITAFYIPGLDPHEIAIYLDEIYNIDVRSGRFCAHQLIVNFGYHHDINSILQVSFHFYNVKSDIDLLINALKNCIKTFIKL